MLAGAISRYCYIFFLGVNHLQIKNLVVVWKTYVSCTITDTNLAYLVWWFCCKSQISLIDVQQCANSIT